MTLNDRLVLIRSHMDSIDRAVKRDDYAAITTFFESISEAAKEGAEYSAQLVDETKI